MMVAYFLDDPVVVHDNIDIHPDTLNLYPGCIPCPDWVRRGDTYVNGEFIQSPENAAAAGV